MSTPSGDFRKSQALGAKALAAASGVMAVTVGILGYLLPVSSFLPGLIGLMFAVLSMLGARRADAFGRQLIGVGLTGQAIAFVMALSGTGWQIDGHFIFLVSMAALATLIDVWVIVTATAIIALHHLGLGIVLPQLVFPTLDWQVNVPRALFHAVMVILLDVGLALSILNRQKLDRLGQARLAETKEQARMAAQATAEADELRNSAEAQAEAAEAAKRAAEKALKDLSDTQAARDAADKQAAEAEAVARAERETSMQEQSAVVKELQAALSRLAAGDMTQTIDTEFPPAYEGLRQDYNGTVAKLDHILSGMSQKTWDLKGQVATIDGSASDVARRTERQVAELEQVVNRIKSLNDSARQSAQSAEGTAKTARDMHSKAEDGGSVVRKAVSAMGDIQASSQEIAKINAVIDGIAFQTNLLALNAGVEAARAGEAGRGFSVVASEVRALALRTTEAASDISRLVSQSETQVQTGFDLVSQTGKTLEGMISDISEMTASVAGIAEASRTQSEGFESVTETISGLDSVAQQNAAMFEETSAACSMLNEGMVEIVDQLGQFSVQGKTAIAAE